MNTKHVYAVWENVYDKFVYWNIDGKHSAYDPKDALRAYNRLSGKLLSSGFVSIMTQLEDDDHEFTPEFVNLVLPVIPKQLSLPICDQKVCKLDKLVTIIDKLVDKLERTYSPCGLMIDFELKDIKNLLIELKK
jgi:hypothetical protein